MTRNEEKSQGLRKILLGLFNSVALRMDVKNRA